MGITSVIAGRLPTFRRGVHPPEAKAATAGRSVEVMPFVSEYVLPLGQSIGAPAVPLVSPGDRVERGGRIAAPGGYVSVALHAPVTGTVRAIELRPRAGGRLVPSIVIALDPFSAQELPPSGPLDISSMSRGTIIDVIQNAGLVGLGGAAFPTHVKLAIPDGRKVSTVLVNGCECEPYLTCDHRIMLEHPEAVIDGTRLLMEITGARDGLIGVESNKPDAIGALEALAGDGIRVVSTAVKYPQGGERMLIAALLGREVGAGNLPLDVEVVVNNVGTVAALSDLFRNNRPLVDRVVTVTGPAIAEQKNLLVPLGTPISEVIDYCGGLLPSARQVVLGGPMMGLSLSRLDVPLVKGASGVLCLDTPAPAAREPSPCIRCARCVSACPMGLNPCRLGRLAAAGMDRELPSAHISSCFECASCSFVCPSSIPLVQWIRMGKALVAERMKEEK